MTHQVQESQGRSGCELVPGPKLHHMVEVTVDEIDVDELIRCRVPCDTLPSEPFRSPFQLLLAWARIDSGVVLPVE